MASIVKRKSKYSVVYTCTDESGVKRQKWETFSTHAEAKKRKAQIEFEQSTGTFIVPTAKTVKDLLDDYVSIYGVNTWALSTYEGHKSVIDNYIVPIIGDVKLSDITPRMMDKFYQSLLTVKSKPRKFGGCRNEFISARQVREIHKILRNAFNQGVRWELMSRNPVANATLPKYEEKKRDIWDSETLFRAIELCTDDLLKLAINVTFSASLRMGELLGLTWDCVDVSEESIAEGKASIFINKELQRVSREALAQLNGKGVLLEFPPILRSQHTKLVLKDPKNRTSVRRVYLPATVAEMFVKRKQEIDDLKELFGEEYKDYNLVFCSSMGTPIEGSVINRLFSKLIEENNLPKVVFHSLRHTSTTYKLKLSGGDIKAVQGDTGHAQATMVTERYAHIIDDDRRLNAERMEKAFYSGAKEVEEKPKEIDQEVLLRILANPEMVAMLKNIVQAM